MAATQNNQTQKPSIKRERRLDQLKDIVIMLYDMCKASPDEATFRKNLGRLADSEDAHEQRIGIASVFTECWGLPVSPAEIFLDAQAFHLIFSEWPELPPLRFLRTLEYLPEDDLFAFDMHKYDMAWLKKNYDYLTKPMH